MRVKLSLLLTTIVFFCSFQSSNLQAADVNRLAQDLKNPNPSVRGRAVRDIGHTMRNDPHAVDLLIPVLQDSDESVRIEAAGALGDFADPRAMEPLIAALRDPSRDVRQNALISLGKIKKTRVIQPIFNALKDKDGAVRQAAARALEELGKPAPINPREKRNATTAPPSAEFKKTLSDSLINALRDQDHFIREKMADILGNLRDPQAVDPLIASLLDKEVSVRRSAAVALGKIKDPRAVEPLMMALQDEGIKLIVIDELGNLQDARAVDPLVEILKGSNKHSRSRAAMALVRIGTAAVEPVIPLLKDTDPDIRKTAVRIISDTKDNRAVELLIPLLKDENAAVRKYTTEALLRFKDPRIDEAFLAALNEKNLEVVAEASNFFIIKGIPGSEPTLIEALNAYGNKDMATLFLNSGNLQLNDAADKWAKEHGFMVLPNLGGGKASWGK